MAITIQLPDDIEQALRRQTPNLDEAARDHFLIAQYRAGHLSTGDLADALGFETRQQAQEWLAQRGAPLSYTMDDLDQDRATLEAFVERR